MTPQFEHWVQIHSQNSIAKSDSELGTAQEDVARYRDR